VFTKEMSDGHRHPQARMNKAARRRSAARYQEELGRPCPAGFRSIRLHDLKHTFGYRLRAAGISFADRQSLLGHKAAHVTTHYSAADIENLISYAEKACGLVSHKSPALSILRSAGATQVPENIGGKGGNRTLDPGIMSYGRRTTPYINQRISVPAQPDGDLCHSIAARYNDRLRAISGTMCFRSFQP
jgi:hypothetical protein